MSEPSLQRCRTIPFASLMLATAALALAVGCHQIPRSDDAARLSHSSLLIVLDGLRPDYVTPELMPNLYALGQRGVVCRKHHAVFPTVTRVNAASIVTGCYPERHGLMGNSVYFPEIAPDMKFNTGSAAHLRRIETATQGQLLTAPSLGEILDESGRIFFAVSSGSSGAAFLLNHKARSGGLVHHDLVGPATLAAHATEVLGRAPPDATPNTARNHRAVDAYLRLGLDEIHPDVTLMWLSDPDHTQHEQGVGAPLTLEAIHLVDAEIGRIVATLEEKGLRDQVNIFVTSDHGFSTQAGSSNLDELLKREVGTGEVFIVEGAIYVKHHDAEKILHIVKRLQATPWVGAIFTRPLVSGQAEGSAPGTLSLALARWMHPRSADILVSANWTDEMNRYGYRGFSTQQDEEPAGHGTSSPFDVHNTLIAAGPDLKSGVVSDVPSGNVDFAPTLCYLNGVRPPDSMQGRVLKELLRGGPSLSRIRVRRVTYRAQARNEEVEYRMKLNVSSVDGRDYFDSASVIRKPAPR